MNYRNQYNLLIKKAQSRTVLDSYFEKHHIVPKSLGGDNSKENIVKLTAKEHFVAHMLLARIYGGGMWQAAIMMKNSINSSRYYSSRMYEIAKKEWKKAITGVKRSPEIVAKIKANQGFYRHTEEAKKKMSEMRKGKPRPKKHFFSYTGLIKCAECGCSIIADPKTKTQQNGNVHNYVYYRCSKKRALRDYPAVRNYCYASVQFGTLSFA